MLRLVIIGRQVQECEKEPEGPEDNTGNGKGEGKGKEINRGKDKDDDDRLSDRKLPRKFVTVTISFLPKETQGLYPFGH